jgi:tetratricopeptide (TPR) repeat protein
LIITQKENTIKIMKFLRLYIIYRLPVTAVLIILGILSHVYGDPILAWILYFLAFISLLLYFMIGTMRIVKDAVEDGNVDDALRYIKMIKFPKLLVKPVRSAYYMLQSTLSMASDDFAGAEQNIRKSLNTKSSLTGDMKGTNLMQLGFIQLRQGKVKEGRATLLEALKVGIPDKESKASVYLQLCSIEIQRQQNRAGKEYFRKAKALNPKTKDIVDQIKIMEKNISRLPG